MNLRSSGRLITLKTEEGRVQNAGERKFTNECPPVSCPDLKEAFLAHRRHPELSQSGAHCPFLPPTDPRRLCADPADLLTLLTRQPADRADPEVCQRRRRC